MELLKIFQFKGLWQAGRRMAPEVGYFRRFTNTLIDRSGRIFPWGKGENLGPNGATNLDAPVAAAFTWTFPVNSTLFLNKMLSLVLGNATGIASVFAFRFADKNNTDQQIMQPYTSITGGNFLSPDLVDNVNYYVEGTPSNNFSMATVYNKVFTASCIDLNPTDATPRYKEFSLVAFDGVRTFAAGLPKPWTIADPSGTPAAHYIRVVYAAMGFDGEPVFSNYVEQRLSSATRTVYLGGYTTYPTVPRADAITPARKLNDNLFDQEVDNTFGVGAPKLRYYDKRFIRKNTISINTSTGETTVTYSAISTLTGGNVSVKVGDWLYLPLVANSDGSQSLITQLQCSTYLLAMQVKSINTGTSTVVFENAMRFYSNQSVTWENTTMLSEINRMIAIDIDLYFQFAGLLNQTVGFSNILTVISYSTTATSGYRVTRIYPNMHDSNLTLASQVLSVPISFPSPFMGVIISFMADWYDVTVDRTEFPPLLGITGYKELLVGHDRNAIYFSDTTLGGSTGMVNGTSNIFPPGSEHGKITAICGSEEFLYVSRERRSYLLRGDLVNGAFTVVECDYPVGGAVNTRACINSWGGRVIFLNAAGLFLVDSSGQIQDISAPIQDLFLNKSSDQNLFDGATYIRSIDEIATGSEDVIYRFFLDDQRGIVFFHFARLTKGNDNNLTITQSCAMAYDVRANAWSELQTSQVSTLTCFEGRTYLFGNDMFREDGAIRSGETQLLATQWITLNEPSLQKQANQVKMYGNFSPGTGGLRGVIVQHQNDWTPLVGAKVTSATYTTADSLKYNHKQRLTASKPQAASIIFQNVDAGGFSFEAIEIEGDQIQLGVKK